MIVISARVLADSISPAGARIVTVEATYPRSIHSEIMTHRVFSRNSASSRAIPLSVTLEKVTLDPFVPQHWGKNQKGMQAGEELDETTILRARGVIRDLRDNAVAAVRELEYLGLHKQIGNRYLEPWLWHTSIITSTEWLNFLHLRKNPNAEPHLADLAKEIYEAIRTSQPVEKDDGDWHLPLVFKEDVTELLKRSAVPYFQRELAKISSARCARVSYLTHEGKRDLSKDIDLSSSLLGNGHMSPFEHAAQTARDSDIFFGNLRGWESLRHMIPGESDLLAYRGEAEELAGLEGLH